MWIDMVKLIVVLAVIGVALWWVAEFRVRQRNRERAKKTHSPE